MKKSMFSILAVTLLLMGCNDSNDVINAVPNFGATTISAIPSIATSSLSGDKNELSITVTADGDWSISSNSDWITHYPSGGVKNETTEVVVCVSKNEGFDARDGILTIKSGTKTEKIDVHQLASDNIVLSLDNLQCGASESSFTISLKANTAWSSINNADWIKISPSSGTAGETEFTLTIEPNNTEETRASEIAFNAGTAKAIVSVTQFSDNIEIPEGYYLVWHDEFNDGTTLDSDWTFEVQPSGWVNNELQNYVKNPVDGKNTVEVNNGFLNINCFKGSDGKVYSGRVYANVNSGWTYGYFEARINLPSGKGTWPAFWMMPVNFTGWPDSGEIDIMEEVGTVPNEVSSSLHALGHYHVEGTQVTAARTINNAEGEFHTYALEWTPDLIITYVDGVPLLTYANDGNGDYNWPYHTPFYIILNLAWGGDWGGMNGINESALPVTMLVDYVRVFQKP